MASNNLRRYWPLTGLFLIFGLLFVVSACLWSTPTAAAQAKVVVTKPKGLTLSPLRSELDIAPGTSFDGTLMVANSTNQPMAVHMSAEEFSVINPQYDYAFTAESDVAKWATFTPEDVSLAAGKSQKVTYNIGVPLTAEPGGRYISLFASTDTATASEGVKSRQRIASLLYITVDGDVTRVGHLLSLTSPWAINSVSMWSMALQNTGTTHFHSRYNVSVQNLLSHSVAASMSGDALILPGTVRAVSDTLPSPKLPGLYKVVYTIGLGDTPAVVETHFVLYLPLMMIVSLAAIILLVSLLVRQRLAKR